MLQVRSKSEADIKIWQTLSNQFVYLYDYNHTEFKKEFSLYLSLDFIKAKETMLQGDRGPRGALDK